MTGTSRRATETEAGRRAQSKRRRKCFIIPRTGTWTGPRVFEWIIGLTRRRRLRIAERALQTSLLKTSLYLVIIFALHIAAMMTMERMGLIGRGEGMGCMATATVALEGGA